MIRVTVPSSRVVIPETYHDGLDHWETVLKDPSDPDPSRLTVALQARCVHGLRQWFCPRRLFGFGGRWCCRRRLGRGLGGRDLSRGSSSG